MFKKFMDAVKCSNELKENSYYIPENLRLVLVDAIEDKIDLINHSPEPVIDERFRELTLLISFKKQLLDG